MQVCRRRPPVALCRARCPTPPERRHEDAPAASEYAGPVLLIHGGIDAFVTAQLARAVLGRFADVRKHVIDRGGHWLHIAYPDTVAATILEFNDAVASRPAYPRHRHDFRVQIFERCGPPSDARLET